MEKLKRRVKKKPILVFSILFFIFFLVSSLCLTYSIFKISNIENILRYSIDILIIFIIAYLFLGLIKIIFKGKNPAIILYDIMIVLLFVITSYACSIINNIYSGISSIYKETTTYEVSVISKGDNFSINELNNNVIGIINEASQKEINEISIDIINENNIKNKNEIKLYDSSSDVISALYNEEVDIAIVPSNYVSMFSSI